MHTAHSIAEGLQTEALFLFVGKSEFGEDEDAHVIGDCVKVLACIC